ncbi:MAG: hypothetical protein K8R53_02940 [Bacteroidales bacterium]|nr:hypothetical protein [Bacteroidales bacterium]
MKTKKILKYVSMIFGIIVTLFLLLVFVPKIIGEFVEKGLAFFVEISNSFVNWDDPMAFFITYIIGYMIIWWRPLWGSIIIIFLMIYFGNCTKAQEPLKHQITFSFTISGHAFPGVGYVYANRKTI